jgi:arylsulfatase A-like enzyme
MSRLRTTLFLLAASLLPLSAAHAAPPHPNVVVFLIDDLGWADLGCYGSTFHETPNLDKLAASGVKFTHSYSAHTVCSPTRAALLSGQYAPRAGNGVYNVGSLNRGGKNVPLIPPAQNEDVPAKTVTVAEAFRAAGYVTAHFGKYHVGGHEGGASTLPEAAGFQFNFGGGKAGSPPGAYISRKTAGKWAFKKPLTPALDPFAKPYSKTYVRRHGISEDMIGKPKHLTDALADAFEDFLAKHESGAEADKPIYVHFWTHAVHSPIRPRADLAEKFTEKKKTRPSKTGHDNAKYAALISDLDQTVGRILKALDDPNGDGDTSDSIAADTLLVFASDNGGTRRATSNRPLRQFKGTFYEGGIRVPLIVRWPGKVKPGTTCKLTISTVDFFATAADALGKSGDIPSAAAVDSFSILPALLDPENAKPIRPFLIHHSINGSFGIRKGDWKLCLCPGSGGWSDPRPKKARKDLKLPPFQLFNLAADPGETKNLAGKNPEIAENLARLLANAIKSGRTTPGPKQSNDGWPNTTPKRVVKLYPFLAKP